MSYVGNAKALRRAMDGAGAALTDAQAVTYKLIYPHWSGNGVSYSVGDRRQYDGALYKCLTAHTSQADWAPTAAPSLWAKVLIPDPGTIPEWEQPDSTNPYMAGDKVMHNGKTWVSDIDNNVWEPGVYGWTVVTDALS